MSQEQQHPPVQQQRHSRWRWIAAIVLASAAILAVVASILVSYAEPILRARTVETLSTRFNSKVELDGFHVSLLRGLQVYGAKVLDGIALTELYAVRG